MINLKCFLKQIGVNSKKRPEKEQYFKQILNKFEVNFVINYELKQYFLKKCKRLVNNANHFTFCFDILLDHISNWILDTHTLL